MRKLTTLFRETKPHIGFEILRRWADTTEQCYVVTSNVDGHFRRRASKQANSRNTWHHGEATMPNALPPEVWDNDQSFTIDGSTLRSNHVPSCKFCGGVARPNVLLFNNFLLALSAEPRARGAVQ